MEDHVHRITTVGARVLINETWYKSAEQQGLLMLHRARDLLMRQGFGLEVDGRMKAVFPTQEEAQKSAEILKARYPLLQARPEFRNYLHEARRFTPGGFRFGLLLFSTMGVHPSYRKGQPIRD